MSLSSIQNLTPYKKLFHHKSLLKHLNILGCVCYANINLVHRSKFDPKANPCIFLGYPRAQKAYKLLDLVTSKIIISRDVTLFEKHFSYHYAAQSNTHLFSIYPTQISLPRVTDLSDLTHTLLPDFFAIFIYFFPFFY